MRYIVLGIDPNRWYVDARCRLSQPPNTVPMVNLPFDRQEILNKIPCRTGVWTRRQWCTIWRRMTRWRRDVANYKRNPLGYHVMTGVFLKTGATPDKPLPILD